MKTRNWRYIGSLIAALGVAGTLMGTAEATVIYNGASFGLTLESQAGTTYDIRYSVDLTGWNSAAEPNQSYIAAVNFKPNYGAVATSFSLTDTDASGTWTTSQNNASASGCTGGSTSFICSSVNPLTSVSTTGSKKTYYWDFELTYASALDAGAFYDAPIRAWFVNGDGVNTGLMSLSTDITGKTPPPPVPEPSALALLGAGLVLLWLMATRRRRDGPAALHS